MGKEKEFQWVRDECGREGKRQEWEGNGREEKIGEEDEKGTARQRLKKEGNMPRRKGKEAR